jgi:B12-binding domain/radical SAM domain protein
MDKSALVLKYNKWNKYSFAALVGALELDERLLSLPIISLNEGDHAKLTKLFTQYDHLLICYSFMSPCLPIIKADIQQLKTLIPASHMTLIAGGPHSSASPHQTINLGFDVAVIGEGERVFPELVHRLLHESSLSNLPSIAYLSSNGTPIVTPPAKPVDLNRFPPFAVQHRFFSPIEVSRGCPWGCKYCQTPVLFGRTMRHRSPECILTYAKLAVKHGFRNAWFTSPNALAYGSQTGRIPNITKLRQLLQALQKLPLKIFYGTFPSEIRPDFVTQELLDLLHRFVDNTSLAIGAQSGSDRILAIMSRGHDVNTIYHAIDITLATGFTPHVDIIFNLPHETTEDQAQTMQLIKNITKKGAKINAHTFMPLPGTPFAQESVKPLPLHIRKFLSSLAQQGQVYGHWIIQMEHASELACLNQSKLPNN